MIKTTKAKNIAASHHGGLRSALYQFASSGQFDKANTLRYFQEIETALRPDYNLYPSTLTKLQETRLNDLKEYLLNAATSNGLPVVFEKHNLYGYLVPYLDENVSDELAEQVTQVAYMK